MGINILSNIAFKVDTKLLLEMFHLDQSSDEGRRLLDLAHVANHIGKPKALYKKTSIEMQGDDFVIVNGVTLTSRILRKNLKTCHWLYPYILTCGTELATWAASLDDMFDSLLADKIMGLALDEAVSAFEQHLKNRYGLGLDANMNPGSLDDWPLSQQKHLFRIFGDSLSQIDVRLTKSYLMLPLKSLSGIRFPSESGFSNCQLCGRPNCLNRRTPYNHEVAASYY